MRAPLAFLVCIALVVAGTAWPSAVGLAAVGLFVGAVIIVRAIIIGITRLVVDVVRHP